MTGKIVIICKNTVKSFIADKGFDKASTLTFYTLMAIIPLLAIGFGIALELGFEKQFISQLQAQFASQPLVADKLVQFAQGAFANTSGGIIASFGIIVLFWTVFSTIGSVASFFDDIWQLKKPRTLWQQAKSYIPLIFLFPIFLVGSNSALIYMTSLALASTKSVSFLSFLSPVVVIFFRLLSFLLSCILLSFFYIYLPNTKVSWKAGILAGLLTGIFYFIWQWIYIFIQAHASSYGTIYGSFAAVPLFLLWLNYSWLVVIFGAELCYHIEKGALHHRQS